VSELGGRDDDAGHDCLLLSSSSMLRMGRRACGLAACVDQSLRPCQHDGLLSLAVCVVVVEGKGVVI
jgi:hypothetical protein